MRVVPDNFSTEECEAALRYGSAPFPERWCIVFETEEEAEEARLVLEKLMMENKP